MSNAFLLSSLLSDAAEMQRIGVLMVNAAKSPAAREKLVELLSRRILPVDPTPTPTRTGRDPTAQERQARFHERQSRAEIVCRVVVNAAQIEALGMAGVNDRAAVGKAIEARLEGLRHG